MVILLVTGSLCAGKGQFAEILKEKYGYTVLNVTSAKVENLWDFDKKRPILENKEKILKETKDLINLSLKNWDQNQVIYPIYYPESVDQITKKRSYFKIVGIVSPLGMRLSAVQKVFPQFKDLTKKDLLKIDDFMNFKVGITECLARSEFQIFNKVGREELEQNVSKHDLITKKIFRPSWDTYFMKLAHVVRQRSNCMKRSVGAIIVQGNRIVSTGYNGTPRILMNCYQGGCKSCNENLKDAYDKCNCIHAEEAAVLECGVHRAAYSTLYTTSAPCRWCVKILIQAEVSRVVYDEKFFDADMNQLMEEAAIQVDCISYQL